MSKETTSALGNDPHRHIIEILPWYANGSLDPREAIEVEAHLVVCPGCREELQWCRDIAHSVQTMDDQEWVPSPGHFDSLMEKVNASSPAQRLAMAWRNRFTRLVRSIRQSPAEMRWMLAMQTVAVVLLTGALVVLMPYKLPEYYQTLSAPTRADPDDAPRVKLALSEDIKEKEIRSLLLSMHASIVQGPNSLGVYVVALPKHSQLAQVLGELRAHPKVRFAERAATATR
ncbi:MAG: anti-sigma factor family protein [Gammaproteobacteria bacterium]